MIVSMQWSEANQKWLMHRGDVFLNDFWNCGNVIMAFPDLNKNKKTKYEITIKKVEEDGTTVQPKV